MTEVEVDEGVLTWDGRVLELFRADGRTGGFRLHVRTIDRWDWEARRGGSLLRVFTTQRHYESAMVAHEHVGEVEAMMAAIDASRT